MTAAESRRLLPTIGWFLLGFVWLWLVSTVADAVLSSLAGVTEVLARSTWARATFLFGAALMSATMAVAIARRHRRWGAETLRAAWIVGAIDIGMALAAAAGARNAKVSLAEGAGFLTAAALFSVLSTSARSTEVAEEPPA